MNPAQLTEERLRTAMLAQADRERLCLGLLQVDGRFSNIRPRRPKGGPDGGRDIEAENHVSGSGVIAAVGFRNSVTDSAEDKAWAVAKFEADAVKAREAAPVVFGNRRCEFIFFTNVDLTTSEVSALAGRGHELGFSSTETYYRERIRGVLDSSRGLALRFQYLGVSLSAEEQSTFFSTWGNDIQQLVANRFSRLETVLQRMEFLQDRAEAVSSFAFQVFTDEHQGPFRASFFVASMRRMHVRNQGLLMAMASRGGRGAEMPAVVFSPRTTPQEAHGQLAKTLFGVRGFITRKATFDTLGELHHASIWLAVSANLVEHIVGIRLIINGYELVKIAKPLLSAYEIPRRGGVYFPRALATLRVAPNDRWVYVRPNTIDEEAPWMIDLSVAPPRTEIFGCEG